MYTTTVVMCDRIIGETDETLVQDDDIYSEMKRENLVLKKDKALLEKMVSVCKVQIIRICLIASIDIVPCVYVCPSIYNI